MPQASFQRVQVGIQIIRNVTNLGLVVDITLFGDVGVPEGSLDVSAPFKAAGFKC